MPTSLPPVAIAVAVADLHQAPDGSSEVVTEALLNSSSRGA